MTMAIALRIVLILLGCYLLVMTLLSLARRKMSEQFCLVWALMSVLMVLTGLLLKPYNRTFWCSVGTVVYQYAGIHSD